MVRCVLQQVEKWKGVFFCGCILATVCFGNLSKQLEIDIQAEKSQQLRVEIKGDAGGVEKSSESEFIDLLFLSFFLLSFIPSQVDGIYSIQSCFSPDRPLCIHTTYDHFIVCTRMLQLSRAILVRARFWLPLQQASSSFLPPAASSSSSWIDNWTIIIPSYVQQQQQLVVAGQFSQFILQYTHSERERE